MRKVILSVLTTIIIGAGFSVQAQEDVHPGFFEAGMRERFAVDLERFPDVPLYTIDLAFEISDAEAQLSGSVEIFYTNTTGDSLDDIVIRVYPNLPSYGGEATVENITIDDNPVQPQFDETRSVTDLSLLEPLEPGEAVEIRMDYSVRVLQGVERLYSQFSYLGDELSLVSVMPLLSVYEPGVGWWRNSDHQQGDAVYSETANFDVTLTYPADLKVIACGSVVEASSSEDGSQVTTRYAAPLMRDFSIMASSNYDFLTGNYEDITINVHYLPGLANRAASILRWTIASVEVFTEKFGPYVYSELDVVAMRTRAGGIEYPGMFLIAVELWNGDARTAEHVTAHEAVHEWWYGMVGNDQTLFPWLDEALTEYSVALYFGEAYGDEGYDSTIGWFQQQFNRYESENPPLTVGQPSSSYSRAAFGAVVYRKGGYFFHVLSQEIGEDVLIEALKTYLVLYRYEIATPTDLQTVLEKTAGRELDDLFIEWVGYSN